MDYFAKNNKVPLMYSFFSNIATMFQGFEISALKCLYNTKPPSSCKTKLLRKNGTQRIRMYDTYMCSAKENYILLLILIFVYLCYVSNAICNFR